MAESTTMLTTYRKMDMLNTDLGLQNQYDDRNKPKKGPTSKTTPKSKSKNTKKNASVVTDDDYVSNDNGFHFSAYVPVDGEVWKLDGLDRQPRKVGTVDGGMDWMHIVCPIIQQQMSDLEAGDGLEYCLLGVVADPADNARRELASNIKSIRDVQARLNEVNPEWRVFSNDGAGAGEADLMLDVSDDFIDAAESDADGKMAARETCPEKLVNTRQRLVNEQRSLREAALNAIQSSVEEEREARERRVDYGPIIRTWLSMLAEKEGLVKELIEDLR